MQTMFPCMRCYVSEGLKVDDKNHAPARLKKHGLSPCIRLLNLVLVSTNRAGLS